MSAQAFQAFSRATLPVTPWKNGGGDTREIACWPLGAGLDSFGWRISIATIAAPGPFSVFSGIERQIMLLEGDGVALRSDDGRVHHRLDTPHQPFAFNGDARIHCTLLGGPSSDFNVMTRRGQWRAQVQVLQAGCGLPPSPHGLLLALQGSWAVDDHRLASSEGLLWTSDAKPLKALPQSPNARLVLVSLFSEKIE